MQRETSLYLDGIRFAAALTVFVEHLRLHTKTGFGSFWRAHSLRASPTGPHLPRQREDDASFHAVANTEPEA